MLIFRCYLIVNPSRLFVYEMKSFNTVRYHKLTCGQSKQYLMCYGKTKGCPEKTFKGKNMLSPKIFDNY